MRLFALTVLIACSPDGTEPDTTTPEPPPARDVDGDGFTVRQGDCDDADALVYPGAADVPYDGIDSDCDGASDYDADGDLRDDAAHGGNDCDDTNPDIFPGAIERCNGVDDDCNEEVDEEDEGLVGDVVGYVDVDGDGAGDPLTAQPFCALPPDRVTDDGDCDDTNGAVYPGAPAVACNGLDEDCDVSTFEGGQARVDGAVAASLSDALAQAVAGSTIELCEGLYLESALSVAAPVTLTGLGGASMTVIDAAGAGRVMTVGAGPTTLRGVTLTGGDAGAGYGGGILVTTGELLTLDDVVVTGNTAIRGGGISMQVAANLALSEVSVDHNVAITGGGLNIDAGATISAEETEVTWNEAYDGGGIASVTVAGFTLAGGGTTLIANNVADDPGYGLRLGTGGGIYIIAGDATLSGIEVSDNTAEAAGGILLSSGAVVSDTVIRGNVATEGSAGGISLGADSSFLTNVEITGNTAQNNGGAFEYTDYVALTDCVISDNEAINQGGGAYSFGYLFAILQVTNTDWGTGAADNTPEDLFIYDLGQGWSWDGVATFSCNTTDGC